MIKIKKFTFSHPIISTSGCWAKTHDQIKELLLSGLSGVTIKTCTYHENSGNEDFFYEKNDDITLNNMGCPNYGFDYYLSFSHDHKKPLIFSVLGNDIMLEEMLYELSKHNFMVEINVSCPNINNNIIGYDFDYFEKILKKISIEDQVVGIKLPPYLNVLDIKKISSLINNSGVSFIVCSNSIPSLNGYAISGKPNKHISLGNIKKFKEFLKDDIYIIGSGGVSTKEDVNEYLLAGANLVGIGSMFYEHPSGLKINKFL